MSQDKPLTVKSDPFLEVFQAELEHLEQRRGQCLPPERGLAVGGGLPKVPSTRWGLVGLAFSGGGIRSASLSLGVAQALARNDLLRHVDYLSTVSGGGYLGACLSSLLAESGGAALSPEHFPLRKQTGEPEPPALRNIRSGSNYLDPPGLLNGLALPAVMIRGILLTVVALLPIICGAVLLTSFGYEVLPPLVARWGLRSVGLQTLWPAALAATLFVALAVLFPFSRVFLRERMGLPQRSGYQRAMAAMLVLTGVLALLALLLYLVDRAAYITPLQLEHSLKQYVLPVLTSPWTWVAVVVPLVALASFRLGRRVLRGVGLSLAAAIGPLFLLATYLVLCVWLVSPPRKLELTEAGERLVAAGRVEEVVQRAVSFSAPALSPEPLVEAHGEPLFSRQLELSVEDRDMLEKRRPVEVGGRPLYVAEEKGVIVLWGNPLAIDSGLLVLFIVCALLFNARFLNVNYTSLHTFYRDQLSPVFLTREDEQAPDRVRSNDRLKLSRLSTLADGKTPSSAPYHLINATVNLSSEVGRDLRGRNGDLFLFSKYYTGSKETGWCRTQEMEAADPHLDLGTAMAISGAAASPNMGSFTMPALSFLMTLLNIRLGYWLPNPLSVQSAAAGRGSRLFWGPGPMHLFKEALGLLDLQGRYVNVSDGGHLENLGVYELLRRRCKLIIAVDGEADPGLRLGALATVMRLARIDLGVSIHIDPEPIHKVEGKSRAHWARGTIDYGQGELGTLIYIKSSLTGDESPYVRSYAEQNPTFPHESTADQFFSETQLEVYRALGEHMVAEDEGLLRVLRQELGLVEGDKASVPQPAAA